MMAGLLKICDWVSAIALSFMLAVVSGQVITRALYSFSQTRIDLLFPGGIELASYSLLLVVFASLPRACAMGLVNVDLFTQSWPAAINHWLDRLWMILTALVALGISWQAWQQTQIALRRGFTTQDLNLPLSFFYGYVVIMTLILAVVAMRLVFCPTQISRIKAI